MFTNANVRPANDAVWSATGATRALTEGNGVSENAYGRPHAPRSGAPNNTALTGLHFDISSASELRSATHRSRISDRAPASARLLGRIRASYRRPIGDLPSDQVSQVDSPIWSLRRASYPSHPLPASYVDSSAWRQLAANRRTKPTQLRPKRRSDSAQTKWISSPIPRPVHRIAFTTLQSARTMTRSEETHRDRKQRQRSPNQP